MINLMGGVERITSFHQALVAQQTCESLYATKQTRVNKTHLVKKIMSFGILALPKKEVHLDLANNTSVDAAWPAFAPILPECR